MGIKRFTILTLMFAFAFSVMGQNGYLADGKAKKDEEYKIALVLPFNSNNPRTKLSEVMLDYYVGFKLGVEQVSIEGFQCKLYVFDNTKDSTGLQNILGHKDLPKMDVIVGPIYDDGLNQMSHFCDSTGQILITPLRYFKNERNKVSVINFFPSPEIQVQSIVDRMTSKYPNHTFYIAGDLTDESSRLMQVSEEAFMHKDVTLMDERLILSNGVLEGDIKSKDSLVIISASKSEEMQKVMDKLLKGTNSSFGVAHYETHKKTKQFRKYSHVLFPDLYHYNKGDSTSKRFYRSFKLNQMGAPSKYAGIGYDQAVYISYSLMAYGKEFRDFLPGATYQGIRNKIFLRPDENGNITNYGMFF